MQWKVGKFVVKRRGGGGPYCVYDASGNEVKELGGMSAAAEWIGKQSGQARFK